MQKNTIIKGLDGYGYRILKIERIDKNFPEMSRYKVKRLLNNDVISNFPAYLLVRK